MPYIGKKPADVISTVVDSTSGTFSGEVAAGSLDISGNVDVDGTLESDAITVNGTALATVIAGTTVTNATNSAHVLVTDNESTNEENLIAFVEGATSGTGNVGLEMDGNLAYNPSTGTVSATVFKGNVDAVDGDFDGTLEADAITIGGTAIASVLSPVAGSSSIVTTGALNAGSITSGFGAINNGASAITTTGVGTFGSVSSQNTAKVWANLNGSSFGLRDSFNVSSASDQGTGTYNFNYSTNLANTNYSIEMGNSFNGTGAWACFDSSGQQPTTSLWNMRIINRNGGAQDSAFCFFAIHGD
tara:strand:+ start:182 stop:1087 length:906 start_codon:yes stop_codon:yes gene_type:complete